MRTKKLFRYGGKALLLLLLLSTPAAWLEARSRTRVSVGFGAYFGVPIYHGFGGFYYPSYYPQEFYVPVPTRPYYAFVDTDIHPEEAEVYLDGKLIGIADDFDGFPEYLAVKPGRHNLTFRHGGFRSLSFDLRLQAGELVDLDRKLPRLASGEPEEPAPPTPSRRSVQGDRGSSAVPPGEQTRNDGFGILRLAVSPADARVELDGDFFGTGAEISRLHGGIPLRPGEHRIDVILTGYRNQVVEAKIVEDEETAVRIALKRR